MNGRFLKVFAALLLALLGPVVHAAGTVTYVYTDPQGTPLAEANASGVITATFDYRPYGSQVLGSPKPGPGYTGHVEDPDTGFVYMQARYFHPDSGRFLSTDPAAISPGNLYSFSRYVYVNNNPARYRDPTGKCIEDLCIGEAIALCAATPCGTVVAAGLATLTAALTVKAVEDTSSAIAHQNKASGSDGHVPVAPALPTGLVGDEPTATGKYGGKGVGTTLPSDKFDETVKKLTGGVISIPNEKGRSTSPNGVSVRTGGGKGPRIDIPANGDKPPEIIHFPEDTPIPENLRPTS